jgi:GMP synthase-like glutamine amidotransferase
LKTPFPQSTLIFEIERAGETALMLINNSTAMKPIRIFRHEDWIKAGHLTDTLERRGVPYELIAIDEGMPVPGRVDDVSGLAFLGGTMSVNDPLPWIEDELRLIRRARDQHLPVLGHCLGSQLISKALGGVVKPMAAKEIGWHNITLLDNAATREWLKGVPRTLDILPWHHDESTLPEGATPLYESRFCQNQAFVIDNMVATVAHVEVTSDLLREWLDIYGYDLNPVSDSVQSIEEVGRNLDERIPTMQQLTNALYDRWLAKIGVTSA